MTVSEKYIMEKFEETTNFEKQQQERFLKDLIKIEPNIELLKRNLMSLVIHDYHSDSMENYIYELINLIEKKSRI